MNLTTPYFINVPVNAFDADKDYTFRFNAIGGSQVIAHELEVQGNSTDEQVYLNKISTFQFEHKVLGGTLINGKQYKVRVRTFSINDNSSEWSRWELFNCFTTPSLTISNLIDSLVDNTNYEFIGSYSQVEGEELESYKFYLYDINDNLIAASLQKYDTENIKHTFSGLKDNSEYKVELRIKTLHGMEVTTGKLYFRVTYVRPQIAAAIQLKNIYKDGMVKVTSNIIEIVGTSNLEPIPYIDGMVDLRQDGGYVEFDEGFNINGEFTLKLWCRDLIDNTTFLELYGEDHTESKPYKIQLIYLSNRIHLYKIVGSQKYYIHSQELYPTINDLYYIWLQSRDFLMDMKCSLVREVA